MLYKVEKSKTALLVIDVQKEYFEEDCLLYTSNAIQCKENILSIISHAKEQKIPIIYIQHIQKADGSDTGCMADFDPTPVFVENTKGVDLIDELHVEAEDILIIKNRYNSFVNTPLHSILQEKRITTLIICGLMTNYCCLSTTYYAHDLDYKPIFVLDAVQGPDMPDFGYGEIPQDLVKKVIATSLLGGIADVCETQELLNNF